jgi:HAD superfamily hydrolase (TIGR01490 family)
MNHTRVAFFDVDGTLTTSPSMFRFLRFYLAWLGRPPHEYDERYRSVATLTVRGLSREESNRAYFTHLAGAEAATVSRVAEQWYRAELGTGGLYHEPALAALHRHQRDGDHVVLVSGALPACLRPIAADLGVDEVWCAEPEIVRGHYTGALRSPPMIGAAKAAAVASVIARRRTTSSACVAYGDHSSDLPMLVATGSAVVVGGDGALRAAARAEGWRVLPGTPSPPALPLPLPREEHDMSPIPAHHETPEKA